MKGTFSSFSRGQSILSEPPPLRLSTLELSASRASPCAPPAMRPPRHRRLSSASETSCCSLLGVSARPHPRSASASCSCRRPLHLQWSPRHRSPPPTARSPTRSAEP
ncbi:uncharacterized protein ANIA_10852 [Aspergillus nidulans FGSC A4]|uniref:Uncharacterized protein n=1 Tax=Emericella nidulans (strain FGSC A4 / ATCC 38163 / CBS 112.46 / NRRL 194 / M139) TaxID=227321 RepID=C8V1N5_EMENI|nr:hypothetical protein [Aspergillus nidulans FGSC A4]CBF71273.1 TPA: conserved hypothetical protein [Aspergillus nidulans FGSC A4]